MSMSGGVPMQTALTRVSREMARTHPDLACELAIISRQTEAGSLEQAMKQFGQRFDVPDVTGLTAMVRHTERLGSPIAETFRQYADSIRSERRQRAEERGNKTSVKLLFPVIFCLAPPVYILLLGPAVLELRDFMLKENRPGGVLSQRFDASGPTAAPADRLAEAPTTRR
jgi:tight adherence protein C